MSNGSVNVGTLNAVLAVRDQFTDLLNKFEERLKKVEAATTRTQRTTKTETDKISEAYKKVAASLDPTVAKTQKYEKAVETLNAALKAGIITQAQYNAQLEKAQAALGRTQHWTSRLGQSIGSELVSNFTRFIAISALATVVISSIVNVTKQLIQANIEAEASERRVEEAVRRYGDSSGVTVGQVNSLAQSISRLTGIDDELIADAEVIGLKFNRIGSDIFPRFSKAAVDLSVATGQDLSSAFEKAGKIVNQPLRGLTLLSREGYAVGASQAEMVKSMVSAGDIMGAQSIMLDILEGQYGGAAAAARDTMGGALKALGTTWENFLERVGQDNMGPLRAALEHIITLLENATDAMDDFELGYHKFRSSVYSTLADLSNFMANSPFTRGEARKKWAEEAREAQEQAAQSGFAIARILMGVEFGHKRAAGSALEQTEAEQKLGEQIAKVREQVELSIQEHEKRAENARNLWLAATLGVKEYNAEILRQKIAAAIQAEENKLRAHGLRLTLEQKSAIAAAIIEQNRFELALRGTLDAQKALAAAAGEWDKKIKKIFEVNAGSNDPDMKKLLDNLKKAEEIVDNTASAEDKRAKAIGEAARLYKDGLITSAQYQRVLLENADQWVQVLSKTEITAQRLYERFELIVDSIAYDLVYNWTRAWEQNESISKATWDTVKSTGLSVLQDFVSQWLSTWFRAMAAWLARWIATQTAAQAATAATGFASSSQGLGSFAFGFGSQAAGAGGAGAGSGMSAGSLAGWALAAYGLFVIYKGFIEDHKRKFAEVTISNGQWEVTAAHGKKYLDGVSKAAESILASLEKFMSDVDVSMERLGTVILNSSKNGVNVSIPGSTGKLFSSMEEAISYAQVLMLKYGEFSDSVSFLVQSVIKSTKAIKIEELNADIEWARSLETQNLEDFAKKLRDAVDQATIDWNRAEDLFLSFYDSNLPAFAEAVNSIITRLTNNIWSTYNSLMGIEEDPDKAWERKRNQYRAERLMIETQLKLWRLEIEARIKNLQAGGLWLDGFNRLSRGTLQNAKGMIEIAAALDPELQALNDILALITRTLEELPPLELPESDPGKGKGKGGKGRGAKDSIRDWIDDKKFDLDTRNLEEWAKIQAEITRQYDEQIKAAGKDKALRQELIALKERELALLAEEQRQKVRDSFEDFTGKSNAFTQVKDTAEELIKAINDSPFGDPEKAAMIADILAEVERRIDEISLKSAQSLFGSLIKDLEAYGATDAQILEARRQMAIIEHTLKVANYRIEFEILKANGTLSAEVLATLGRAIDFVAGIDPTKFVLPDVGDLGGSGGDSGFSSTASNVQSELEALREAFKKAKESILDTVLAFDRGEFGAVTPQASWEEAKRQFDSVVSSARAGNLEAFEKAPEAFKNALDVLEKFSPALYSIQAPELRNQLRSLADLNTVKKDNLVITDFEKRQQHKEVVNTLTNGFADLSKHAAGQEGEIRNLSTHMKRYADQQQDINLRLMRLESATIAK